MLNLSSPFLQVLDNIMKTGHKLGLRFKFTEVDLSHTDCSMRYIFIWIERLIDWLIDRILNNYISTNISLISEQFSMVLTARANQWIEKKRYFILLVSFHPACFWFALISIYLSIYLPVTIYSPLTYSFTQMNQRFKCWIWVTLKRAAVHWRTSARLFICECWC